MQQVMLPDADRYLSLHDGVCTSLALLIDTEGNEAVNDDCCGYYGPSGGLFPFMPMQEL